MKALIFDLDDTLYDQLQPFRKALLQHFSIKEELLEPLYVAFRRYADDVFELAASGEMPMEESHIYRMKKTLLEANISVSDEKALAVQKDYAYYQGHLELAPSLAKLLSICKEKGVELGIITNGPHQHQLNKLHSLGVENWIGQDRWVISGEIGITKPSLAIFQHMEALLGLPASDLCYVGDSFENDVIGAKNAGWQVLWFNHRNRVQPDSPVQADWEMKSLEELVAFLENEI